MQAPARRTPAAVLVLLILTLALPGCASLMTTLFPQLLPHRSIEGIRYERDSNPESIAKVGQARVDLTPTPGIAMNYSLNGKVSRGFWTRLYARAVYVQDTNAYALVFVSADLPHIPNGLHDRVAELVSGNTEVADLGGSVAHLGREQIILAATHAHNSAENYFSDAFYNGMVSARPGFDPFLFEFLARHIARAIIQAHEKRQPLSGIKYRSARLDEFFRNRSLAAFLANGDSAAFIADRQSAGISGTCPQAEGQTDERGCQAVRARVEVVDFFATPNGGGAAERLTSMVFLAVHPTVLGAQTEVFQADLLGATAALLEQKRLKECVDEGFAAQTVALFNGAQGDVSATWKRRDRYELLNRDTSDGARRGLAVQLARFICGEDAGIEPESDDYAGDLHFQFERIPLANQDSAAAASCGEFPEKCTVAEPVPGVPAMGGAEDGRTFWYEIGAQEGLRSASRDADGRKATGLEVAGSPLDIAKMVADPNTAPKEVPIGIYRIGRLVFATLPGEFTTMLGEKLRKSIGAKVETQGVGSERVILIGLANGHVSYVTTAEEYDVQHYEGAQNLYGAATGPMLEDRYERLGAALNGSSVKLLREPYQYDPGTCRVFQPYHAGAASFLSDDGLQNILLPLASPDKTMRTPDPVCWVDAIPKLSDLVSESPQCTQAVPYVWIEPRNAEPTQQCKAMFLSPALKRPCDEPHPDECVPGKDPRYCAGGTIPQDNCGLDMVTVLHGVYHDRTRWCVFWTPPADPDNDNEFANAADFVTCVAGVTGVNVREADRSVDGLPFDLGDGDVDAGYGALVNSHRECCGVSTRPVCEFP